MIHAQYDMVTDDGSDILLLNVGGRVFKVKTSVLRKHRYSRLARLFECRYEPGTDPLLYFTACDCLYYVVLVLLLLSIRKRNHAFRMALSCTTGGSLVSLLGLSQACPVRA